MADAQMIPSKVHLVGSVRMDTAEEMFREVGPILGRRLKRIPDGEPGGRSVWVSWQYPVLIANAYLKGDMNDINRIAGFAQITLRDGVKPEDIQFGELGYEREARASYQDFVKAREQGYIAKGTRFQVCLPTPLAVIAPYVKPQYVPAVEPAYERAMIDEVKRLCAAIPHKDLCIQWDFCIEMIMWDGRFPTMQSPFKDLEGEIMGRLNRLCAPIPDDVELGFHLCYGDWEGEHFIQPEDAGKLVEVANAMASRITHPIAYIHMPVPKDREDDAYYAPLKNLKLKPGTELYLGVVHKDDDAGTKRRIAAAAKYVSDFGIATECGMARARDKATARSMIKSHAAATREPS